MVELGFGFMAVTVGVALIFDFFNGMNDSANSTATIIATRVLRPWQAVILASFFNFLGAFIGLKVAATVGKGIIDPGTVTTELILAGLLGAIAWVWLCTHYGLPISVSHSLIGGLLGSAIVAAGLAGLILPEWSAARPVFVIMGEGALGGLLVGALVGAFGRKRQWASGAFAGAFLFSGLWLAFRIFQGTVQVKGLFATVLFIFYSPMLGFVGGYVLQVLITVLFRRMRPRAMRQWFGFLQIGSASFYSLGHGTNDAQKTMGVIAALLIANGYMSAEAFDLPLWVIIACASAIALGTIVGGYKVVHTMGMKLTHLEPHQGFSAETASGVGLYFLAQEGVPVSTTHSITGSILGAGAVRGGHRVSWKVARTIVGAWFLTIPASAAVGGIAFFVLDTILNAVFG